MAEKTGGVLAEDRSEFVRRQMTIDVRNHLLGMRPGAIAMRIISFKHDVLDADAVSCSDCGWIIDCAEPEVALQYIGWSDLPSESVPRSINQIVETIEQHRDPTDTSLGHGDL